MPRGPAGKPGRSLRRSCEGYTQTHSWAPVRFPCEQCSAAGLACVGRPLSPHTTVLTNVTRCRYVNNEKAPAYGGASFTDLPAGVFASSAVTTACVRRLDGRDIVAHPDCVSLLVPRPPPRHSSVEGFHGTEIPEGLVGVSTPCCAGSRRQSLTWCAAFACRRVRHRSRRCKFSAWNCTVSSPCLVVQR